MTLTDEISALADHYADRHGIDPNLVRAVILQESGGNPWVTRFEAPYRYVLEPNTWAFRLGVTPTTEEMNQKTSWGLMQTMGGVARELGFTGHLTELTDPGLGLEYGCLKLKECLRRARGDMADAVAAYNAGSVRKTPGGMYVNQRHVDKVMGFYRELVKLT